MGSTTDVLHDLARRAVEEATRRGFHPVEWRTMPTKTMWIVTELDELLQAAQGDGDMASELADVALRTMGILHVLYPGWEVDGEFDLAAEPIDTSLEVLLWPCVRYASRAAQAWRKGEHTLVQCNLQCLLTEVFRLASRLGFQLLAEMERKLVVNSKRPHLHGTVEALG